MVFELNHLGPIDNGIAELGKLTVFCGSNNTGKTYMNYLIYGFFRFLTDDVAQPVGGMENVYTIKGKSVEIDFSILVNNVDKIKKNIEKKFLEELPKIFSINEDFFSSFSLQLLGKVNVKEISYNDWFLMLEQINEGYFGFQKISESVVRLECIREDEIEESVVMYIRIILNKVLYDYATYPVYMLPAERNGLNMFFRELNINRNNIFHRLGYENDARQLIGKIAKYPLPISDYINLLNDMGANHSSKNIYGEYASTLEEKIVHGKFQVSDNGGIQFLVNHEKKLDFHLSSSTAKSLFGLDYLLKNVLAENYTLIIDEPEQNLHPDNQRYIARLLGKLVNAKINVIISTHSDYIIRELNNLILLSNRFKGYEKLMKTYGYEESELLKKEDVKGYIFKENTIEQVQVDEEGMKMDIFDEVINSMNQASDDIYFTYCEGVEDE